MPISQNWLKGQNMPTMLVRASLAWVRLSGESPMGLGVKPSEVHNVSREIGRVDSQPDRGHYDIDRDV